MMEHEQVNDRCVALSTQCTKMTGRVLAKMMQAYLKEMREPKVKRGKQSLASLKKQGADLADIEISGDNIGSFKKIAREYNVDYALKKDTSLEPPKWVVFFKAKDDKSLESAFKKYVRVTLKQKAPRESILAKLNRFKELARSAPQKIIERIKDVVR